MRIVEDFPAPFGPSKPNDSPCLTEKLIPFTAVKSPNFLTKFLTTIKSVAKSIPLIQT
jgi:hypothetical protein